MDLKSLMSDEAWSRKTAGALFFLAGCVLILGTMTAESLYPGYSIADDMVSDLGDIGSLESITITGHALVFILTMVISGLSVLAAAHLMHAHGIPKSLEVPIILFGLGAVGVGIFTTNFGEVHNLFALIMLISGPVAAFSYGRMNRSYPFGYVSILLSATVLLVLLSYVLLGDSDPLLVMGVGGLERWVAYPTFLWIMGYGANMMQ